jgi:hypothetical protein
MYYPDINLEKIGKLLKSQIRTEHLQIEVRSVTAVGKEIRRS